MNFAKQKKVNVFASIGLFLVILTALSACSTKNYGRIQSNPEATELFKNFEVLPGHKYYYRGTTSQPLAVVAIKEKYKMTLDLWVEIDPNSNSPRNPNLETMAYRVSMQGTGGTINPWGFTIFDQNGNDIGLWYSALRNAQVQVNENNEIVRLFPGRAVTHGPQPQTSQKSE